MVCELHFDAKSVHRKASYFSEATGKYLEAPLDRPLLAQGAVPTILPNCPEYLSRPEAATPESPSTKRFKRESANIEKAVAVSIQASMEYENLVFFRTLEEANGKIKPPDGWIQGKGRRLPARSANETISLREVAKAGVGTFIIGGTPVDISQQPYIVALLRNGAHICGATLVSRNIVITAAHCVDRNVISSVAQLQIRAGSTYRNSGGQVIQVQRLQLHEDWDEDEDDNDIAILWLSSAVTVANAVPIGLAPASRSYAAGVYATISGWGDERDGAMLGTADLRTVNVPVVGSTYCRLVYGISTITARMWCAGYAAGGRDSCQGDSGGPAVINNELAGVVSFGHGCALAGFPGVYASIPAFRSWIQSHTGI